MMSLLLHKSKAKLTMNVNNKGIIGTFLGYIPKDCPKHCLTDVVYYNPQSILVGFSAINKGVFRS